LSFKKIVLLPKKLDGKEVCVKGG